jgi:hypothetical protein
MDNFDVAAFMQGAEAEQAMIEADLQKLIALLESTPSEEEYASVLDRMAGLRDRKHALGTLIARAHTFQKLGPYPTLNAFPDTQEPASPIYVMTTPEESEE